jgi:hypothetical protein
LESYMVGCSRNTCTTLIRKGCHFDGVLSRVLAELTRFGAETRIPIVSK